jgi:hypothetical protein
MKEFKKSGELTPAMQKKYDEAFKAEKRRIMRVKTESQVEKIREKAKADAVRAMTPMSKRVTGGLMTVGREFGRRIEKIDTDKFEAYVTGVSTSKPRKK